MKSKVKEGIFGFLAGIGIAGLLHTKQPDTQTVMATILVVLGFTGLVLNHRKK